MAPGLFSSGHVEASDIGALSRVSFDIAIRNGGRAADEKSRHPLRRQCGSYCIYDLQYSDGHRGNEPDTHRDELFVDCLPCVHHDLYWGNVAFKALIQWLDRAPTKRVCSRDAAAVVWRRRADATIAAPACARTVLVAMAGGASIDGCGTYIRR